MSEGIEEIIRRIVREEIAAASQLPQEPHAGLDPSGIQLDPRTRLTIDEVAARIGRHVVTVRMALNAEELHGTQMTAPGGRWRVQAGCADAWGDGRKCEHQLVVPPIKLRRYDGTKRRK